MRKIALVFPGQGSQYAGMGKALYNSYESVRKLYDIADELLGADIKKMIFEGEANELKKTENTQIAVFLVSMAAYQVYKETIGIKPVVVAGHSLGEITALTAAGVLDFKEALSLVRDRSRFMSEAGRGRDCVMYAIQNLHYETVEKYYRKFLHPDGVTAISNYNSLDQIVISGDKVPTARLADILMKQGALVKQLRVSGAFHSPVMKPVSIQLKKRLEKTAFGDFQFPVLSNRTGEIYLENEIAFNLSEQVICPVQWIKTVQFLDRMGIDTVVEVGPGKVLSNLIKGITNNIQTYLFDKMEDVNKIKKETEELYEEKRLGAIRKCISIAICTKNYNDNEEEYKNGVIDSISKLKSLQQEVDANGGTISKDDIEKAKSLLLKILQTKKVPEQEKDNRLSELEYVIS